MSHKSIIRFPKGKQVPDPLLDEIAELIRAKLPDGAGFSLFVCTTTGTAPFQSVNSQVVGNIEPRVLNTVLRRFVDGHATHPITVEPNK